MDHCTLRSNPSAKNELTNELVRNIYFVPLLHHQFRSV